jgi:tyrosyl-tRNA synthetase
MANAKTYQEQAFKILDPERTRVVFNGEWFEMMSFEEVIHLNSRVTLQQMLQREDFRERFDKGLPVRAHEIQYPIMQGWDSVKSQADVEIGGTDQLFNIMVGRDLQREEGQPQQVAMMLPILEGLDGVQKMSKSLGNAVGVTEPPIQMFGKLMSIPDEVMPKYYELLLAEKIPDGHPMDLKKALGRRIVARFHSEADAQHALDDFNTRFSQKNLGDAELPAFILPEAKDIVSIVVAAFGSLGVRRSRSDARRLVEQGSVQWNGEKITDPKASLPADAAGILKLDKTRAVRVG